MQVRSHTSFIDKQDIVHLQAVLLHWYHKYGRQFPWREENLSEYELIIAEVLLQRTKAEKVAAYFPQFIAAFPDWLTLASTPINELQAHLKIIGLATQKADRMNALACEMVKRKGDLPTQRTELETIPCFGQYITNAVQLLIFKKPSPLLDANMSRLIERYFGPRKLIDIRYDPYLQELASRLANHPYSKEINWAVLDFAAAVCQAQRPKCTRCVLNVNCAYFEKNMIQKIDNGQ